MIGFQPSLRSKLLALLALSVGAAVLPFVLYTADSLKQGYLESAWRDIRHSSKIIDAALETQYQIYLTNLVTTVTLRKEILRKTGTLIRHTWENLETMGAMSHAQRETLAANQLKLLGDFGLMADWAPAETGPQRALGPLDIPADWEDVRDIAGRPLITLLANPSLIQRDGVFVVFKHAWPDDSPPRFFLLHLVPTEYRPGTILLLISLDDLHRVSQDGLDEVNDKGSQAGQPDRALAAIITGLKESFKNFIYSKPEAAVSLLDRDGKTLARQGHPLPDYTWLDLLPEARRLGQVEKVLESAERGPTIARLTYFQPLETFVALSLPESSISGPARAIVRHIIWLGVLVMGLVLAAGFYFAGRLTRPLNLLTARTNELAKSDFSRPEATADLLDDLPLGRGDEVGRLARAFARLGRDLSRNIEERLAATSAKERLEGELGVARDIQMGLLPSPDSLSPAWGCLIQGFLLPAKEVGGDFYDFFPAPDDRLAVVIGDVSDKGAPAALFMAMTVTLARQTIEKGLSPAEALTQINDRLVIKNPEGLFVTLFLGLLDLGTGEMEFANGGHCPPILVGGPEGLRYLKDLSGLVLGALPDQYYAGFKTTIHPSEICILYTDGVTEAQDEQEILFGLTRLEETAAACKNAPPDEMNRRIYEATLDFRGPAQPSDDLTLLSFRLGPAADKNH